MSLPNRSLVLGVAKGDVVGSVRFALFKVSLIIEFTMDRLLVSHIYFYKSGVFHKVSNIKFISIEVSFRVLLTVTVFY